MSWSECSITSSHSVTYHRVSSEWSKNYARIALAFSHRFSICSDTRDERKKSWKFPNSSKKKLQFVDSSPIETTKWWASHVHLIGSHSVNEWFSNVSSGVPLSVKANEKRFGDLTWSHLLACSRIKTIFRESSEGEWIARKKISQNYVTSLFWAFFTGGVVRMLCQVVIHSAATVARKLCTMTRQIADTTTTSALKERVRKRNHKGEKNRCSKNFDFHFFSAFANH